MNSHAKDDEQLAQEATRGSSEAFDELVRRYRDRLYRFLLGRCASRADVEDVIQDTFVAAYRYLDSYNPRWRFSTWLYRIAIRNAGKAADAVETVSEVDEQTAADDPLQDCIAAGDRNNLWLVAKRSLSADVYSAMWLHYAEDMPVREVASALSRSPSWTKVNLHRARKILTEEIQAQEATPARSTGYG